MNIQFIIDERGNKLAVFLPIKLYEDMIEAIEREEDVELYDEVKAKNEGSNSIEEYRKSRVKGD